MSLEIAKKYRDGTLSNFKTKIIEAFYAGSQYERGRLGVIYPELEKAFNLHFHEADLNIHQLKERREAKNAV